MKLLRKNTSTQDIQFLFQTEVEGIGFEVTTTEIPSHPESTEETPEALSSSVAAVKGLVAEGTLPTFFVTGVPAQYDPYRRSYFD